MPYDSCVDILRFAEELITQTGRALKERRRQGSVVYTDKEDHRDIVTADDVWTQQVLTKALHRRWPDHHIIAEEGRHGAIGHGWTWVIDPIDGTTNYVNLGRDYAISMALFLDGVLVHGLVLDVETGVLFQGSYRELAQMPVAGCAPAHSLLHISHRTIQRLRQEGADPLTLCDRFRGVRYLGCASLELCRLTHEPDGIYMSGRLKLWDFAAAACVLSEAGIPVLAVAEERDNYFVIAGRSKQGMQVCLDYIPLAARQAIYQGGGTHYASNPRAIQTVHHAYPG